MLFGLDLSADATPKRFRSASDAGGVGVDGDDGVFCWLSPAKKATG
jgi:hypothetical protein